MKLKNAAKYFDRDSVYDAYTGAYLFKAQFSTFEGSSPDGSFNRRRTVSVAPEVVPAPRRAVTVQGITWIMGELLADGFNDKPIRASSSAKEATGLYTLLTPAQAALRDLTGITKAYAHAEPLKETVNTLTNSAYSPQFEVAFGITESPRAGLFLRTATHHLHIRSVHRASEGYWIAIADEIGNASVNCEVAVQFGGAFDPVTETYGAGVATTGILLDMYKLYAYATQADELNKPGDQTLVVAKSAITPQAGAPLTIGTAPYKVIRFTDYADAWNIQVRRG